MARLIALALLAGIVPASRAALARRPAPGEIFFYGDFGNMINSPYRKQTPIVRPRTLYLTEDGSVALISLHWRDWGSSLAHATGLLSTNDCTPSCATGKATTTPARVTLSRPGRLLGRMVYRCFKVIVPALPGKVLRECLTRYKQFYIYQPLPPTQPSTAQPSPRR